MCKMFVILDFIVLVVRKLLAFCPYVYQVIMLTKFSERLFIIHSVKFVWKFYFAVMWSKNIFIVKFRSSSEIFLSPVVNHSVSSLNSPTLTSFIITRCKGCRFRSLTQATVGMVPIAPIITKQASLYTLFSLLIAVTCFIFGHHFRDTYVSLSFIAKVYSNISCLVTTRFLTSHHSCISSL